MRVVPGFAFALVTDLGFAVGLVTQRTAKFGDLVWVAQPVFDDEPDVRTVESITDWRWATFFPTGAAVRQRAVTAIGVVEIPPSIRAFPRMRGGSNQLGWREVNFIDGEQTVVGTASDPSLPITQIVNDVALREKIVTNWSPKDTW